MYKTIYFYKLDIKMLMSGNKYYPEATFYNLFSERLNKNDIKVNTDPNWGNFKTCLFCNKFFIDVLQHSKKGMFGTLGCITKENKLRRLRDTESLERKELQFSSGHILEDYTYFYLDYSIGVISVLSSKNAPHIRNLSLFLTSKITETEPIIFPIKNKNIRSKLRKIDKVTGIELRFAVPPNKLLGEKGECVSMDILHLLKHQGFDSCELKFFLDRKHKNSIRDKEIIDKVIECYELIKDTEYENEYGLKKLGLIAKPEDEQQQTIDVLEQYFTKGVAIKIDENSPEISIKNIIKRVYNELREEILENIVIHNE